MSRGRPLKDGDAKRGQYRLRTSTDDDRMLDYLSENTGLNKSEIIRKAIKMFYTLEKNKH